MSKSKTIEKHWKLLLKNEKDFELLQLDEFGFSDWRCKKYLTTSGREDLFSKLKQGRSSMSNGSDLLYRPKSLNGLEHNNHWVKVEKDGSNLPFIEGNYLYISGEDHRLPMRSVELTNDVLLDKTWQAFWKKNISHYMRIDIKLPLY